MNETLSEEEVRQALFGNAVLPVRNQGASQMPMLLNGAAPCRVTFNAELLLPSRSESSH